MSGGIEIRVESGKHSLSSVDALLAGVIGGTDKAKRDAAQRAASHLRTNAAKAIREKYDISAAALRTEENVKTQIVTGDSGTTAYVTFRGKKIPLHRYGGASPKEPAFDVGRWAPAFIGGEWRRVHPGIAATGHQFIAKPVTKFTRAFVARMWAGSGGDSHTGIFERSRRLREDKSSRLRELMGSSVPQMLGNPDVAVRLADEAMEKFDQRLEDNINRLLTGQWRV